MPVGAKAAYEAADYWKEFAQIVEKGVETTDISQMDNVIYIEDTEARTGSEKMLSVRMKNTVDIAGFEFVLQLPEGVTIAKDEDGLNEVALSTERTTAAKTNYFDSSVQSDGTLKVLCGTSKENPSTHKLYTFSGNDGEVARITVNIPAGYQSGEYAVIVKNAIIADPDAQKTVLPDAETTLTVTEPLVLVLDETSTTVPEATTGPVDIKVKRTLKAGEWSTVCLPFAMTEAQVKEAFGSDVELKEFVDYEAEYDADDNVTNIKVNFGDADLTEYGFEANFPYLIKVSADVSEFTVNSTVEPDESDCYIEYDNGRTGNKKVVYGTFYGTLHAQTTVPEKCLFLSGNKFWYSTGQTKMKAFRGYFEFVDVLSSVDASSARISLSFSDSETTGIRINDNDNVNDNYYDLQGRRVEKPVKGLYIKGNKKVFVK